MHRSLIFAVALAWGLAWASFASAQVGGSDLRLGVGMVLDFGGDAEADWGPGPDTDDDLKLTPGIRLHLDYDVHRYVSVGGVMRFAWWEGDDYFEDRSFLWDVAGRVTGHYDWRDFRFYLAFSLGLSVSKLNEDWAGNGIDPGVGLNIALAPGAEYWFSNRAGVFLEMFGWTGHRLFHDVDGGGDVDFSLNQVVWQTGVTIAL